MALSLNQQLLLAPQVAARAHQHQKRKDGTPYVAHPMRVALRVSDTYEDIPNLAGDIKAEQVWREQQKTRLIVVALLHDVVEDTDVTIQELRELGFDEIILHALDAVTKRPGEKYTAFILRIKAAGPLAIAVKLADIADNLEDQSALDPDEAAFLTKRYTAAQKELNG